MHEEYKNIIWRNFLAARSISEEFTCGDNKRDAQEMPTKEKSKEKEERDEGEAIRGTYHATSFTLNYTLKCY